MYEPKYDYTTDSYWFSPDNYDGMLEEWEERIGRDIDNWDDEEYEEFITAVTGDKPTSINYHKQMLLMEYTK